MQGLEPEEELFLQNVVAWQKNLLNEITSIKTETLKNKFQSYADAEEAIENLQSTYYLVARIIAPMVAAATMFIVTPAVLISELVLAVVISTALGAAVIPEAAGVLLVLGIYATFFGGMFLSAHIADHGAKKSFDAGWVDNVMNFFSHNKAQEQRDQRDNAKHEFEQAKQPFNDRSNMINIEKDKAPVATGSFARFAGIFVDPIKTAVDTVTQEKKAMDNSNETTAFTEFQPLPLRVRR